MNSKDRWTAEEYRRFLETGEEPVRCPGKDTLRGTDAVHSAKEEARQKKRKYGNEPTTVCGIRFDSKHEARVYQDLMARVKTGELRCVCRQVKFDLPGGIRYFADFVTIASDNTVEVIDAKSEITRKNQVYINKKKQIKALWGIDIKEV